MVSKREKAPDKRMRRIALVICEGETEENYLNLIRARDSPKEAVRNSAASLNRLTKTMITTLYKSKTICDDEENFIHNVDDGRRIPDHGTGAGNDDCYRKGTLLGSFRGGAA